MNSVCILLTDHESINEDIIILSYKYLLTIRINKIYFIGSKKNFIKIYNKFNKKKKFEFINIELKKIIFLNILNLLQTRESNYAKIKKMHLY